MGWRDLVQAPEELPLDIEILRNGLDDKVGRDEVLEIRGEGDARQHLGALDVGELAALHCTLRRAVDRSATAFERVAIGLDGDDAIAVARAHLRDAGTHGAEANHSDSPDLHAVSLPSGSEEA